MQYAGVQKLHVMHWYAQVEKWRVEKLRHIWGVGLSLAERFADRVAVPLWHRCIAYTCNHPHTPKHKGMTPIICLWGTACHYCAEGVERGRVWLWGRLQWVHRVRQVQRVQWVQWVQWVAK